MAEIGVGDHRMVNEHDQGQEGAGAIHREISRDRDRGRGRLGGCRHVCNRISCVPHGAMAAGAFQRVFGLSAVRDGMSQRYPAGNSSIVILSG